MVRKYFIAGARCPKCKAEDKVRFCRDGEREWIECVACGYVTDNPGEPEHPQPAVEATEVDVVRLQSKK